VRARDGDTSIISSLKLEGPEHAHAGRGAGWGVGVVCRCLALATSEAWAGEKKKETRRDLSARGPTGWFTLLRSPRSLYGQTDASLMRASLSSRGGRGADGGGTVSAPTPTLAV
jgi:hypothetical protein